MGKAAHLWAVAYDDMGRAEQVRDEITRLAERHCLILLDTAVVVRYPDGSVTLDGQPFVVLPRIQGRIWARFFAALALAAPPLTGAAVGAYLSATGTAGSSAVGIGDDFVRQVAGLVKPGASALFVLD